MLVALIKANSDDRLYDGNQGEAITITRTITSMRRRVGKS